jgi:hypothetical protein
VGTVPNSNGIREKERRAVSWFYSDVENVVEIGDVADGEL